MKKYLLTAFICLLANCLKAQTSDLDVIVMNDGEEIECKVTEVGITEIKYKLYDADDAPVYTIIKSTVFMIKYAYGFKEVFNDGDNDRGPSKTSRYRNYSNLGALIPIGYGFGGVYFSFETINGLEIDRHFDLGVGLGIDLFEGFVMIPLFVSPQITFLSGKVSPLLTLNVGYSFSSLEPWNLNATSLNPQLGIKVRFENTGAFIFNAGIKALLYDGGSVNFMTIKSGISF